MISLRFHIVSIIAVFLAIAIGIVVGATFVDRATVDLLQNRIDNVEENLDARRAEIAALESELDRDDEFISTSADFAVTGRLVDVPVAILALRGIDEDAVTETALLARRAGARIPGVIWVEPKWALESEEDQAALAAALETTNDTPEALQAAGLAAVVGALAEQAPPDGTSAGPDPATVLGALTDAGFLTVEPLDDADVVVGDLVGSGARLLMATGAEADDSIEPLLPTMVDPALAAGLVTVAGEVWVDREDGPRRGELLIDGLGDERRNQVTIVDDLDLVAGRVAAILALDAAVDGVTGHFGFGPGADAVIPVWSSP